MPRHVYYSDRITLKPGEALITYQYEPNYNFKAGFNFENRYDGDTTRNRSVRIEIYGSSTIGGDGKTFLEGHTFSTNIEDNMNNSYWEKNEGNAVVIHRSPTKSMRYFNAKYINKSSFTINLNVFAGMD